MIKIEIFQGKNGDWYWHLKAANGESVCWSEGYVTKQGAVNSANWVKVNAPYAQIVDL